MIDVDQLLLDGRAECHAQVAVWNTKAEFLHVVAAQAKSCLSLLESNPPTHLQISAYGWANPDGTVRVYGAIDIFYLDQLDIPSSLSVLEMLEPVAPADGWRSSDEAASLTRTFSQKLAEETSPAPSTANEINLAVHWSVKELEGGCSKRLVRIDHHSSSYETPVYEIVCNGEVVV